MQIESSGTEYNSPRTGYPSTIINPGDSPDILATKERFISTLPDNEGRRIRETRGKRGTGRKRERDRSDLEICAQKIVRPPGLTGTMDSPDRDFPRRGNELTSCQTSSSRKGLAAVECR